MRHWLLLLWVWLGAGAAFAQQGAITGRVLDKKTGEGVIGATVLVTGTVQAAPVQLDGSYRLELDPGTYAITITYVGYKTQNFPGVAVQAGQNTTLNATLEESATSLKEVTVTGVKQTGTEVALIQDLKKSEVVVSGVSADQIVKTLDRDASEVVRRIPGVTVQSNNFIVIRGLAERYNTVLLNDALTPSAEVDTRSFSFDILPSSVIDRVLIYKSGAPELPGEFGGGVVSVYTKNSVLENTTSLTVSGWSRSANTFQDGYLRGFPSATDWLGFDNGRRALPPALSALIPGEPSNAAQTAAIAPQLRNEFVPSEATSRPDLRVSLGLTRKFEIGRVYISNVTSISYSNTQEQYNSVRQRYLAFNPATPNMLPDRYFNFLDTRSLSAVRLGVIHNYQARLNDYNRLELRNFLNQYGTDEVVRRVGLDEVNGLERRDFALHYQSRTVYSGQLAGSHTFGARRDQTVNWAAGYNYVYRNEPDYRQNQQQRIFEPNRPGDANPTPFEVVVNIVPTTSARFFSTLRENTYMSSGQYERRLPGRDTTSLNQYKLRAGYYVEEKERSYEGRFFNYNRANTSLFNPAIGRLPLTTIFSPENLRVPDGFNFREGTFPQDRYTGTNRLVAGYVSAVAPISDKFNLSGGVRLEYNRRRLRPGTGGLNNYEEIRTFVLPSFNATYNFTERSLLRAAGSLSVNRPEFREIAEFTFWDFSNNFFIEGNKDLRTARLYNADLRYEFYPSRSELLSVGVFGKRFLDAIEQTTQSVTGTDLTLTFQNAPRAYAVGVEVEARKSLREMTENAFLQRVSFALNASLIRSQVSLDTANLRNQGFAFESRPLQGQSPYVVNLGVFYQDDESRWQGSLQYNVVGPRIAFVGDTRINYSVYEMPRHMIDLALTRRVGRLEVRAGIQNLLNQEYQFFYDLDRNGRINGIEDAASFARFRRGSYSTLGLTYRF